MAVGASRAVNPFDRGKRTSNGVNGRTASFTTSSSQQLLSKPILSLQEPILSPMDESWLGRSTSCVPEYVPMVPPPVPCRRHEAFEFSDIEYGPISREVAEGLCTIPGEYLIRRGTTRVDYVDYKLTIRRQTGHSHFNIYKDRHPFSSSHCIYFLDDATRKLLFVNVTDLITHIIRNPSSLFVYFEHDEFTLQPCSKLIKRVLDPMLLKKGRSINLNITSSRKYFAGKYGTEKVVLMEKDNYLRVLAELSIRAQFRNHPNILQYLGVTVLHPIYMVFPIEAQSCLHKHIKQLRSSKTKRMISICHDVCCALIYMHSNNYIHRSLQTRACVIDRHGVTKILDLGKSCHTEQDSLIPSDGDVILVPTRWAAPEVLRYSIFSKASDVWSFGVFVWEVFNKGKTPYYDIINEETLLSMLKPGFRLSLKKKHSQYDILLEKCLKYNANNRPSLDILERTIQALVLS